MAILDTNFEFTLDRNTNCYFTFLDKDGILIPIQCDTGASRTSISMLALVEGGFEYSEENASRIEDELLNQKNQGKREQIKGNNLVIELSSATGNKLLGFLADMGKVSIGDTTLDHFYYYFVPRNKTAFALLGNDFLNNCEYNHSIRGNIVVTKFDEDSYVRSHQNALTQNEIKLLINSICQENTYDLADDYDISI